MDSQSIAWIASGVFVAAVFSSFVRTKMHGAGESQKQTDTIRSRRDEMFEYFGIKRNGNARLLDSLDLSPLEMLSSRPARKGAERRRGDDTK